MVTDDLHTLNDLREMVNSGDLGTHVQQITEQLTGAIRHTISQYDLDPYDEDILLAVFVGVVIVKNIEEAHASNENDPYASLMKEACTQLGIEPPITNREWVDRAGGPTAAALYLLGCTLPGEDLEDMII